MSGGFSRGLAFTHLFVRQPGTEGLLCPSLGSKGKATGKASAEDSALTSGPLLEGEPSSGKGEGRRKRGRGVPFVAQQSTNPTRIPEDAGSIPGLAPWNEDLVLP